MNDIELSKPIDKIFVDNIEVVKEFRKACKQEEKAMGFLFGQVMKLSCNRAHTGMTREILEGKFLEEVS